ncbi:hypothetical protein [Aeromonas caviae]|uniref:hypothetical protein n=1 Tax=Aeromonas caviae TaxID=648 RepID=UPI000FEB80C1|nr:hypothetical protein [Aeromonas caviae]RWT79909.1 hypothetical protein DN604_03020 [Aeromonas caviae]
MHPELFIERNVAQILTAGGYTPDVVHTATQVALRHFRTTPCFAKGQAFGKCLAEAKKMAKLLQRKLRQQEKDAKKAAKPTRVKKVSHG